MDDTNNAVNLNAVGSAAVSTSPCGAPADNDVEHFMGISAIVDAATVTQAHAMSNAAIATAASVVENATVVTSATTAAPIATATYAAPAVAAPQHISFIEESQVRVLNSINEHIRALGMLNKQLKSMTSCPMADFIDKPSHMYRTQATSTSTPTHASTYEPTHAPTFTPAPTFALAPKLSASVAAPTVPLSVTNLPSTILLRGSSITTCSQPINKMTSPPLPYYVSTSGTNFLPNYNTSVSQPLPNVIPCMPSNYIAPRKVQELPQFSGVPEDWPLFENAFSQSTAAYGYNNFENNQRLQRCLKGEAREVVKSLLIHPENVGAVMEQLKFRFGRPELLVRSQLKQIKDISPISDAAIEKLIPFSTKVKNLCTFLQAVDGQQHISNPTLLEELISKLSMSKKLDWAKYAAAIKPYPTILDFSNWLSGVANLVCLVQDNDSHRRVVLHASDSHYSTTCQCPICQGPHKIVECRKFLELNISERWIKAKDHRLCFSCLRYGHSTRNCRQRVQCKITGCNKLHHKLLHDDSSRVNETTQPDDNSQQTEVARGAVLSCSNETDKDGLLFRVIPVTLYGTRKQVNTYALMDEGSSVTIMDRSLMSELEIEGQNRNLNLQWLDGKTVQESSTVVNLCIGGTGMRKRHQLRNVYVVSKLSLPVQSLQKSDLQGKPKYLKNLVKPFCNVIPKILIGLDHCHLGIPSQTIKIKDSGPFAANTELGWVVFGPTRRSSSVPRCLFVNSARDDENLHSLVKDYFSVDNFGVRPSPVICSEADKRARNILETKTVRVGNRFQAALLWNVDEVKLPDSYSMAEKRLIGIERKMKKDFAFATAYKAVIDSYVQKNYAKKLTPSEVAIKSNKIWYLPHFGVYNPNKPGKLRLVFDAAAEVNGTSLNSCLLKGPQEYMPLPSVLFNFRKGSVAVCGDIKEMFHQVVIQPGDRCAQRFLWRNGEEHRPPDIYEMQVMTFGAACSPCTAQYVKCHNALEYKEKYPRAVEAITKHHYVDDFVDSFSTMEEALNISKQVREIHAKAGFELRQFISNSPQIVMALEGHADMKTYSCTRLGESASMSEKVLGMYWNPYDDTFRYELKFSRVDAEVISGNKRPTKRQLLSIVMSVFDPLGFLSNFLIAAKLLMREVWRRDITWDEPLPDDINSAWMKWRETVKRAAEVKIPRHYFLIGVPEQLQLHIFVDASEEAFAAVAYWRFFNRNNDVGNAFICAKSKCAPLKQMSVPRLELQAAVLGTRLMQTIMEEHALEVSDCVLWSDSSTVIKWIFSEHRRYKPFVAHRVAEILAVTKPSNWRWLPTHENVADEATRWKTSVDFCSESRWFNGPEFLLRPPETWPKDMVICKEESDDVEELRCKFVLLAVSGQLFDFRRFSSFKRITRTAAWVKRFITRSRREYFEQSEYGLSVAELDAAETMIYNQVHAEVYATEIQQILTNKTLSKDSHLYKLTPILDEFKVLRVGGRIEAASWLPYRSRHPIILPPKHKVTTLVMNHFHCLMKHQNLEATICEIRKKFWIPRLRTMMRGIVANCSECKLLRARPARPIMGPLPEDRLTPFIRPFTYTGVDYFGPLDVTIGRRHEKRWVALFTCLSVRAIHLEIAHDLSTDSCILAIRNFINRRGIPVRIRSDNGRNFIGTDKLAKKFTEVFDCGRINDELASSGIEWIFNCPNNPAEGGVWERMVQCVKRVLRQTLKEVAPREHTLHSFLIEAENIVNSRPLTHLPVSADQEEPLTPNHFLLGSANTLQTPCVNEVQEKTLALRKQWRIARQLRDHFWKRWISEYLPTLTRRSKWCERLSPIKIGDLVFICDSNVSRRQWCRGMVVQVYSGVDGEIRRADVKTSTGVLRRPVSKLAVLDIEADVADE